MTSPAIEGATTVVEPAPSACPSCGGRGWIKGAPGTAGRECECRIRVEHAEAMLDLRARIPARFRNCTRASWRGPWPKTAPRAGAPWWRASWAAVILGARVGIGKTHLATALFLEAAELAPVRYVRGFLWISTRALIAAAKAEFGNSDDVGERSIVDQVTAAPLLLLDDFGSERGTEYNLDLVAGVLCERYDRKAPTIISTNVDSLAEIARVDPRLASRLAHESVVIRLSGRDRRIAP